MLRRWIGSAWIKLNGWRVDGTCEQRSMVLVCAPHTTNWDLAFMLAAGCVLGIRVSWIGKHTLFRPPMGWVLRALGGIPVDRRSAHGMVGEAIARLKASKSLIIAIPPEGTRSKVDYWKSGFYHIALGANVPIGLGYVDYKRKRTGVGDLLMPTGNIRADMDRIREFYRGIHGKYAKGESIPRLKEEDAPVASVAHS